MKPPRHEVTDYFFLLCVFVSSWLHAQTLEQRIEQKMREFGAESVAIYLEQPDGRTFTYNADEIFHAASTMKVPVMMEVFRQVEAGKLKLDTPIVLKNEFTSIIDGSPYSLTKKDDSDTEIYSMIGKSLTLKELVERMINQSSNLSTNTVIDLVGAQNVMQLMKEIGAKDMTVMRGVEDIKAYEAGKNNTTSARALAMCMKTILDPEHFQQTSRQEMFRILLSQHFQKGIAAGIRARAKGLSVASKDGWITKINHDAAIIRDQQQRDSILVILTKGVEPQEKGEQLVAALAGEIWNRFMTIRERQL